MFAFRDKLQRNGKTVHVEIHLLHDDGIRNLYWQRLDAYLDQSAISPDVDLYGRTWKVMIINETLKGIRMKI